jgi:surface antigen/GH25 family lysozyme M1 (1,4-beta-N-acetylmuramidase)
MNASSPSPGTPHFTKLIGRRSIGRIISLTAALVSLHAQHIARGQLSVSGVADIALAGQGLGAWYRGCGTDTAPLNAPVEAGLALVAGQAVQFTPVSGSVGDGYYTGIPAEGSLTTSLVSSGEFFGLSSVHGPRGALVGVFLNSDAPTEGQVPPPKLDFSTRTARDQLILRPLLRQVFYVGRGKTSLGELKSFIVPRDATRFFLGVLDSGGCNSDNTGSFSVSISGPGAQPPAVPALTVNPTRVSVAATSGSTSFNINNTGGGTMSYSASVTAESSWLQIPSGGAGGNSGTINVSHDANTGAQRSGTIVVTANGASGSPVTLTVVQAAPSNPSILSKGSRVMAAPGGANVRDTQLADQPLFTQNGGVHGTIIGGPVLGTAGKFTGNWWEIDWDSEPPNQNQQPGWSAESVILLAPTAGDVPKPDFASGYYTTDNIFWKSGNAPASTSPPTPQLGTALGNCTWFAHGRLLDLGYDPTQLNAMRGNASLWDNQALANGVPVDSTPKVGSIAQTDNSAGGLGHVGVVESVNRDGTITVTESSYSTDPSSVWNFLWRHRTVTATWFERFIHVSKEVRPPVIISPGDAVSPGRALNSLTPTFAWTPVAEASGYGLYISDQTAPGTPLIYPNANGVTTTPLTGTSYTLPSGYLVNGHAYRWGMTSFSGSGESGQSSVLHFQTSPSVPTLSVTPTSVPVADAKGTTSFDVKNTGVGTMSYFATVISGDSWLQITSGGSGGNSGTISVSYAANDGTERSGTIEVTANGAAGSPVTITVTQSGASDGSILYGVDVSQNNTVEDWSRVQSAGKSFAFIKATSGVLGDEQVMLDNHVRTIQAKQLNLLVGAYHFAYPNYASANTGVAEAKHFLQVAGNYVGSGYLPPVLDIEDGKLDNGQTWIIANHVSPDELVQWIKAWIGEVQRQKPGVVPMIYTIGFYAQYISKARDGVDLASYPLWIATYPSFPDSDPDARLSTGIAPWTKWTFQQYRSDPKTQKTDTLVSPKTPDTTVEPFVAGKCPGIGDANNPYADLDSFNGDLSSLRALSGAPPAVRYTLTLSANSLSGGSVTPNPIPDADGNYAASTIVTLTAIKSGDYYLQSWSGVDSYDGDTAQVTMSAPRSVTANFTPTQAGTSCGCPVEYLSQCAPAAGLASERVKPNSPPEALDLALIRRFRDEVLAKTPQGKSITEKFYQNSLEIIQHLAFDQQLRSSAVQAVTGLQPVMRDLLDGSGTQAMSPDQVGAFKTFIQKLDAVAGVKLKSAIDGELARIGPLENLAGKTGAETRRTVLSLPLQISNPKVNADGEFQYTINTENGRTYLFEASDDLRTWTLLESRTSLSGSAKFTDSAPPNLRQRFYRVRTP